MPQQNNFLNKNTHIYYLIIFTNQSTDTWWCFDLRSEVITRTEFWFLARIEFWLLTWVVTEEPVIGFCKNNYIECLYHCNKTCHTYVHKHLGFVQKQVTYANNGKSLIEPQSVLVHQLATDVTAFMPTSDTSELLSKYIKTKASMVTNKTMMIIIITKSTAPWMLQTG